MSPSSGVTEPQRDFENIISLSQETMHKPVKSPVRDRDGEGWDYSAVTALCPTAQSH